MKSLLKSIVFFALVLTVSFSNAQTETPPPDETHGAVTGIKDSPVQPMVKCPIDLEVYPYGFNLEVSFNTTETIGIEFKVFDLTGKVIINQTVYPEGTKTVKNFSMDNFQGGLYIINARQGKDVISKKVYIGG